MCAPKTTIVSSSGSGQVSKYAILCLATRKDCREKVSQVVAGSSSARTRRWLIQLASIPRPRGTGWMWRRRVGRRRSVLISLPSATQMGPSSRCPLTIWPPSRATSRNWSSRTSKVSAMEWNLTDLCDWDSALVVKMPFLGHSRFPKEMGGRWHNLTLPWHYWHFVRERDFCPKISS